MAATIDHRSKSLLASMRTLTMEMDGALLDAHTHGARMSRDVLEQLQSRVAMLDMLLVSLTESLLDADQDLATLPEAHAGQFNLSHEGRRHVQC